MINVSDFVEINPHVRIAANEQSDTPVAKPPHFDEGAFEQFCCF